MTASRDFCILQCTQLVTAGETRLRSDD